MRVNRSRSGIDKIRNRTTNSAAAASTAATISRNGRRLSIGNGRNQQLLGIIMRRLINRRRQKRRTNRVVTIRRRGCRRRCSHITATSTPEIIATRAVIIRVIVQIPIRSTVVNLVRIVLIVGPIVRHYETIRRLIVGRIRVDYVYAMVVDTYRFVEIVQREVVRYRFMMIVMMIRVA